MDEFDIDLNTEFSFPLSGGETLYGLLETLNEQFGLTLSQDDYLDTSTRRDENNRIILKADSIVGFNNYVFISSLEPLQVEKIPFSVEDNDPVYKTVLVNFKEELTFFSKIASNKPVLYNFFNRSTVIFLYELLKRYRHNEQWDVVGTNMSIDGFILRYYGKGENVPRQYGVYPSELTVAIVDIKRQGVYKTYCIRNKIYHVYNNGYRSWN